MSILHRLREARCKADLSHEVPIMTPFSELHQERSVPTSARKVSKLLGGNTQFANIKVTVDAPENDPKLKGSPGRIRLDTEGNHTIILSSQIDEGDWMSERPEIEELVRTAFNLPPAPIHQVISAFVFAHELGHVGHVNEQGKEEWLRNRRQEMTSLPVPNVTPGRMLRNIMIGEIDLADYWADKQEYYEGMGIMSPSDLLEAQRRAYRNLPTESYADNFALELLDKNWEQLGFPARDHELQIDP